MLKTTVLTGGLLLALVQLPSVLSNEVKLDARASDKVLFNTNSLKYHILSCGAAKRCTHCIEITRKEAQGKGGVPCKLCGAGE